MYALAQFTLSDMTRCGVELRRLGADASSMEEVAGRVVGALLSAAHDGSSDARACALVRTFVTLPYSALPPEQQRFAARI